MTSTSNQHIMPHPAPTSSVSVFNIPESSIFRSYCEPRYLRFKDISRALHLPLPPSLETAR